MGWLLFAGMAKD